MGVREKLSLKQLTNGNKAKSLLHARKKENHATTEGPNEILSSNGWDGLIFESSKEG